MESRLYCPVGSASAGHVYCYPETKLIMSLAAARAMWHHHQQHMSREFASSQVTWRMGSHLPICALILFRISQNLWQAITLSSHFFGRSTPKLIWKQGDGSPASARSAAAAAAPTCAVIALSELLLQPYFYLLMAIKKDDMISVYPHSEGRNIQINA